MKTKQTKENYTNLVGKALQGDKNAKEQLYILTNKSAYFVALKMTKNENDSMDILQDSYLKAFSGLDKLADPEKFSSWFNCIVANNCRNFLKKKTPDFFSDLSDEDSGEDFEPEDKNAELPSEYSANKEIKEIVHNAINNLPDEQRLCVMMYYFDELSVQQIANALEISTGTVKSRLNYARKKIRTELETLESKGYSFRGVCVAPIISNALGAEMTALSVPAALSAAVLGGSAAATAAAVTGISAVTKIAITVIACVVVTGGAVGAYHLATKDSENTVEANATVSRMADETDSASSSIKSVTNNDDKEKDKDEDEQEPVADDSPITVDDVLNHPETPAEDFEYRDGDFVVIERYIGTDPIVVIPEQINGHPVTIVNANGFNFDSKVKGVSFPSGVTELSGTFNNNKVVQIVVAKGVEEVEEYTFLNNPCLKYVDLGPNLIELNGNQFISDEELEIHIPESTTEIDSIMWEETTTIVGAAGSYAEIFANENGIKFKVE